MGLFGFGKKKEEVNAGGCSCGGNCTPKPMAKADETKETSGVKVLGSGCAKCNQLESAAVEALTELGMDASIEHVTDFEKIAAYGVMSTPALVVDGKVASYGKVLKKDEVIAILQKVRGSK
ncbi:thioredoxin family protein [Anaerotignum sp.]|uniref:thioredoxin family protein n=1 Tax=Anaerotignum sp. TaxID=2039241 RepID=UPI002714DF2C|nr:thioredoxin family protein [Anaerotignum sp.]